MTRRNPLGRRRAVAAVELAVLLPLLGLLFVLAVDFARIFYFSMAVTNCARNGALYASLNPTNALDSTGIETAARKDASSLTGATVTSTPDNTTAPNYVDVTVSYSFSTLTSFPGVPSTFTVARKVRFNVAPLIPG